MAGRWEYWRKSWQLCTTLSPVASPHPCLSCRSNTPISQCGNVSDCKDNFWRIKLNTGSEKWRAHRRFCAFLLIDRGLRFKDSAAEVSLSHSPEDYPNPSMT